MKKFLIIACASLMCFGCGKKNNITINIYENEGSEKVEIKEESKTNDRDTKVIGETVVEENKDNSQNSSTKEESSLDTAKGKVKETYDKIKNWYDENKDELKDINKEILQEDTDTIKDIANQAKTWYDEKTSEDSDSVLAKVKLWYNDNKDNIKDTAKETLNQDKETLSDLFNKKNNE